MNEIMGSVTAINNPITDWAQTDPTKANFIKNKPDVVSYEELDRMIADGEISANNLYYKKDVTIAQQLDALEEDMGDVDAALDGIIALENAYIGGDGE